VTVYRALIGAKKITYKIKICILSLHIAAQMFFLFRHSRNKRLLKPRADTWSISIVGTVIKGLCSERSRWDYLKLNTPLLPIQSLHFATKPCHLLIPGLIKR
jgi:hypothetical protein